MRCLLKEERERSKGFLTGLEIFFFLMFPDPSFSGCGSVGKTFFVGCLCSSQEMTGQFLRHPLDGVVSILTDLDCLIRVFVKVSPFASNNLHCGSQTTFILLFFKDVFMCLKVGVTERGTETDRSSCLIIPQMADTEWAKPKPEARSQGFHLGLSYEYQEPKNWDCLPLLFPDLQQRAGLK